MIGYVLGGRYEIQRRLGAGGMSIVYMARCTYLNRQVAVKVLRKRYAEDEEYLRHFRREAQAAAGLSHPNIVNVHDVGEEPEESLYYIVMEYVSGQSLKEIIAREGSLSPQQAVEFTDQILRALQCAHNKGVIHRDIKPDNIIIDEEERVKVTDFGIARAPEGGTMVAEDSGRIMGSVHYMAPEQARGRGTNQEVDLYSTGVVLYEMLTGKLPYEADSPMRVALEHVRKPAPRASEENPALGEGLDEVIMRALAKDPGRRYSDADSMRRDLQAVMRGDKPAGGGLTEEKAGDTRDVSEISDEFFGSRNKSQTSGTRQSRSEEKSQSHRPRLRISYVWILLLLVFAAVVGYSAYWVWDWYNVPVVDVPTVVELRLSSAESVLDEHGLRAEVIASQHHEEIPANHIISQQPPPGEPVRRGQMIQLTVSEGPHWIEGGVPDVVGLTRLEARVELENVGLEAEYSERYHDEVAAGRIIDQVPSEGTRVQRGTVVQLEVSKGIEPKPFALHGYVGKLIDDVLDDFEELGLESKIVREEADFPPDRVVAQDPEVGTEVSAGDTISLVVSKGNDMEATEGEVTISLAEEPSVQEVRVSVIDQASHRMVFRDLLPGGTERQVTVFWYGSAARVQIYSEGRLIDHAVLR